jgi:RNA polymerase sigma factor (sigma-70 family)
MKKKTAVVPEIVSSAVKIKSTHKNLFELKSDDEVWMEYMTNPSDAHKNWALEELIVRHHGLYTQLAYKTSLNHQYLGTYDDFYGIAIEGAIEAYNKYDPWKFEEKSARKAKISTYAKTKVKWWLMSAADNLKEIKCRSYNRGFRAYFNGAYDKDKAKKTAFEVKHGLYTEEDIEEARVKYKLLCVEISSYEMHITGEDGKENESNFTGAFSENNMESEEDIINRLDWESVINKMSSKQQKIYRMFYIEEFKVSEIVRLCNIPARIVQMEIENIQSHMRHYFPELVQV